MLEEMMRMCVIGVYVVLSVQYAVKSQVLFHGYKIEDAVVLAKPREGEELLRTEDIQALIETHGKQLALVMLPGVQYYTGQVLDMRVIAEMAHAVGAAVGFDCAHAVGNYPLRLHDWNVDFAVWCSYKYLNSGPGGIAGAFVHDRFANESLEQRPFFAGWWGHDRSTRFKMGDTYIPMPGAARFQLSNPPVFQTAALRYDCLHSCRSPHSFLRALHLYCKLQS